MLAVSILLINEKHSIDQKSEGIGNEVAELTFVSEKSRKITPTV